MIYKKSIPDNYVDFVDSPLPTTGVYEVIDGYNYVDEGTHFSKQYIIRSMTNEEITSKQAEVKASWAAVGYPSWSFNEQLCCYEPPVINPAQKRYEWHEESQAWVEIE